VEALLSAGDSCGASKMAWEFRGAQDSDQAAENLVRDPTVRGQATEVASHGVDPRPGKLSALRRACGVGDSTRIVRTARETRLLDGLFWAGRSVETGRLRGRRIQLPVFRDDSTGLLSQPWMLPERKPP